MIHVIATIELQSGVREQFLDYFHQVMELVRQEEGCVEYGPTVDLPTSISAQPDERLDVVTVVEKWEDLESLEAHLIAPHMLAYRERVKALVINATIHILEPA